MFVDLFSRLSLDDNRVHSVHPSQHLGTFVPQQNEQCEASCQSSTLGGGAVGIHTLSAATLTSQYGAFV